MKTKRASSGTSASTTRIRGGLITLVGLVMVMLGLGMWKSPEINWEGFINAWRIIADEIVRLIYDPFAILGIVVMVVGVVVTVDGLRRLARRG